MLSTRNRNLTARQIKAARALLDWSQEDLASASELSIATIRKIESGHISPRDKTMGAIASALEEANIEFTDSTGVKLNNRTVGIIEGDDCFVRLLDEIYHSMKKKGGEVLFMNGDGSRENEAEMAGHQRLRMVGIKNRFLIKEGNTYMPFPLDEFRWVPEKHFRYNLLIIFQDKVAICVYPKHINKDMDKIYIIQSSPLAESMRGSFEFMWENCRKPAVSTAKAVSQ